MHYVTLEFFWAEIDRFLIKSKNNYSISNGSAETTLIIIKIYHKRLYHLYIYKVYFYINWFIYFSSIQHIFRTCFELQKPSSLYNFYMPVQQGKIRKKHCIWIWSGVRITSSSAPTSCRRLEACSRWRTRWWARARSRTGSSPWASSATRWWCRSRSRAGPRGGFCDAFSVRSRGALGGISPNLVTRSTYETICESKIVKEY